MDAAAGPPDPAEYAGQPCTPAQLERYIGTDFRRGVLRDPDLGCVRAVRLVRHGPYPNEDRGATVHFCVPDSDVERALQVNRRLNRPLAIWACTGTRHFLRGPYLFSHIEALPGRPGVRRAVLRLDARQPRLRLPSEPGTAVQSGAPPVMRSRLERRWWRALRALGLRPVYEPGGGSYTPDFSVRVAPFPASVFLEIKPAFPCNRALLKCEQVAHGLGHPLLLLWGACALPFAESDPHRKYAHAAHARGWLLRPDGESEFPVVFLVEDDGKGGERVALRRPRTAADARWRHPRVARAFAWASQMDMDSEERESESPFRDVEMSSEEKLMLSFSERENVENSDGVLRSLYSRSMPGNGGAAAASATGPEPEPVDMNDIGAEASPPMEDVPDESPPLRVPEPVDMKDSSFPL